MLWYELTRWWAYRRIQHPKMKLYVWVLPLTIAAALTVVSSILPARPALTGGAGILISIKQVLAILPGFYIAALAAVATFQRPEMDVEMPAPAPTVEMRFEGNSITTTVSRRMFLSYLFSYLSVISLLLVAVCAAANMLAPSFHATILDVNAKWSGAIIEASRFALLGFVFYWCASILVTTLHGIFFLTERMHQPN